MRRRNSKINRKIDALNRDINELESQAGISHITEAGAPGNFRLRELYFGIEDKDLCKALIAKDRELHDLFIEANRAELALANRDLQIAKNIGRYKYIVAGLLTLICVAAGNNHYDLVGSIGGMAFGFFMSLGYIDHQKKRRADTIEMAKDAQQSWEQNLLEVSTGSCFSESEMETGESDI